MTSNPVYGLSVSGMTIEPSACWQFSIMEMTTRGNANPEPLSVWTKVGLLPSSGLYLRPARRAWKSVQFEQELTSSHSPQPGAHISRS